MEAFGINEVRSAILHQLAANGPQTTAELAKTLLENPQRYGTLTRHLRALAEEGLVSADAPLDAIKGKTLTWTINESKVRILVAAYETYILGGAK